MPPSNRTTADEGTWIQSTLTEYGTGKWLEYLMEDQMGPSTQHSFLSCFPGSPYLGYDGVAWPIGLVMEHA